MRLGLPWCSLIQPQGSELGLGATCALQGGALSCPHCGKAGMVVWPSLLAANGASSTPLLETEMSPVWLLEAWRQQSDWGPQALTHRGSCEASMGPGNWLPPNTQVREMSLLIYVCTESGTCSKLPPLPTGSKILPRAQVCPEALCSALLC